MHNEVSAFQVYYNKSQAIFWGLLRVSSFVAYRSLSYFHPWGSSNTTRGQTYFPFFLSGQDGVFFSFAKLNVSVRQKRDEQKAILGGNNDNKK